MRSIKYIVPFIALMVVMSSCRKQELSNLDEQFYLEYKDAKMPVYVKGNGASKKFVIIIHGGPGGSGLEYRSGVYYKDLENSFGMVYYDQRGSGSSSGSYDESTVTIDQFVDDLHQLVLLIKHKYGADSKVFLLGHSWGGLLGSAYLVKDDYQNEITGWIESDGAHNILLLNQLARRMFIFYGKQEIDAGNNAEKWTEIVDYCEGITDTTNSAPDNWSKLNGYGFEAERMISDVHEGQSGSIGDLIRSVFFSPSSLLTGGFQGIMVNNALFDEVEVANYSNDLQKVTIPCLILYGKYDFVTPPGLGQDAMDNLGSNDKEFIIFNHSGHSPMDNQANEFTTVVIAFVERL